MTRSPLRYRVRRSGASVTVRHDDCGRIVAREKGFSLRELVELAELHEHGCEAVTAQREKP